MVQFVSAVEVVSIRVITRLGIAEVLTGGSCAVAELAEVTGTHALSLYRLLRALARIANFIQCGGRVSPPVSCFK